MAESCWSLVEPCYNPYRCRTVVVAECRHCMRDGEIRDEESHGEGIHDVTLAEEEDQDFREQRTESLD